MGVIDKLRRALDLAGLPFTNRGRTIKPADWDTSLVRYYMLDCDGGNDLNIGYRDDAAGATFDASGLAVKTEERLTEIVPPDGDGRAIVILVKDRPSFATHKKLDGTTDADFAVLTRMRGYRYRLVRGSDLGASCNSVADKARCGFQVALAGTNGDGSWTVGTGTSQRVFTVDGPGLALGTLTLAAVRGMRVRFLSDTQTVALQNRCGFILGVNSGTGEITLGGNLGGATPTAGDRFVIDRPGVRFARFFECLDTSTTHKLGSFFSPFTQHVAGIAVTSTDSGGAAILGNPGTCLYAGFESVGSSTASLVNTQPNAGRVFFNTSWTDEAGTSRAMGIGLRAASPITLQTEGPIIFGGTSIIAPATATKAIIAAPLVSIGGNGWYSNITVQVARTAWKPTHIVALSTANQSIIGLTASGVSQERPQFYGVSTGSQPLELLNYDGVLGAMDIQNAGGQPAIKVRGVGCNITFDDIIGSTGNTDVAVDITDSHASTFIFGVRTSNTVSGTAGEVRMSAPGGAALLRTHAQIAAGDMLDGKGNRLIGAAGVATCKLINNAAMTIPAVSADPSDNPPAGFVHLWFRSDEARIGVRDSAGVVKKTGALT